MHDHNKTSEDRFVKTTINIRRQMMADIHKRMDDLGKEGLIDYLRDLIRLDLNYKLLGTCDPSNLTEFRREIGWTSLKNQPRTRRDYYDPTRKYHGFVGGLLRSSWVLRAFKSRAENFRKNY